MVLHTHAASRRRHAQTHLCSCSSLWSLVDFAGSSRVALYKVWAAVPEIGALDQLLGPPHTSGTRDFEWLRTRGFSLTQHVTLMTCKPDATSSSSVESTGFMPSLNGRFPTGASHGKIARIRFLADICQARCGKTTGSSGGGGSAQQPRWTIKGQLMVVSVKRMEGSPGLTNGCHLCA